ncbi:hypothetical protein Ciccas_002743 [Cichlidogyrus casuarinus]|uniref:Uncharacterized protein n=1 Tax=Cichlidogyrus casuarinus TaxID=1844966 RepID=A0ABD2QGZ6_9PLAT
MTTNTVGIEDLKNFVDKTGDFEKTREWARDDTSVKVVDAMFPILANIANLIGDYKAGSKTVDVDKVESEIEDRCAIYVDKEKSDEEVFTAFNEGMERVLGCLLKSDIDKELGSKCICLAGTKFPLRLDNETRSTAEVLCEDVFNNDESQIDVWLTNLNKISTDWTAAQEIKDKIKVTEELCANVLMYLKRACEKPAALIVIANAFRKVRKWFLVQFNRMRHTESTA